MGEEVLLRSPGRDGVGLGHLLQTERATLSGIVVTLARKGLIDQVPGSEDQRQRVLRIPAPG